MKHVEQDRNMKKQWNGLEPLIWVLNLEPSYTKFIHDLDLLNDKHINLELKIFTLTLELNSQS